MSNFFVSMSNRFEVNGMPEGNSKDEKGCCVAAKMAKYLHVKESFPTRVNFDKIVIFTEKSLDHDVEEKERGQQEEESEEEEKKRIAELWSAIKED